MVIISNIIKFLICILGCFIISTLLKKKVSGKNLRLIYVIILVCSLGINYVLGLIPALTEPITLTALCSKNDNSLSEDLFLSSYTIDGTTFSSGEYLNVSSGHWFWSGETLCWRSELDSRKPDNVTRTVVLDIPVGSERTLNFNTGIWCGQAEIYNGYTHYTVDTFSEKPDVEEVDIGSSSTNLLILNQLRFLMVYVLLEILICFIILIIYRTIINQKKLTDIKSKIIYLIIALLSFIFMVHYADKTSFWSDELYQIYFTHGSIYDAIQHCIKMYECSPPLALIYATIWYHIVPYGETWLLLSDIIPTVVSIYFIGLICEKISGKYCGIIAAALLAFSITIWQNVAYEYRAYAFMLLFSILSFYFYIKRNEQPTKKIWFILFSCCLVCLAMSHYFGMIAGAFYFLADIYLWRKGYIKLVNFFTYLLWGIVNAVWFSLVISNVEQMLGGGMWYGIPGIANIRSLLYFLVGNNELIYWIFMLGISSGLILLFDKKNNIIVWEKFYIIFSTVIIIGTIVLLFIYGNFINTKSTLWSDRYFLFLAPFVCVVCSVFLNKIGMLCSNELIKKTLCLFLILFLLLECLIFTSNSISTYPYREVADYIYTDINYIFDDDTIILGTSVWMVMDAWNEYYISRQGKRDLLNVVSQYEITEEQILQYNKIYIEYIHINIEPWLKTFLDENYNLEVDRPDLQLKIYVRK